MEKRSRKDIVVIGASAGGVQAVTRLVSSLPADYSGSLFVSLHFPENAVSVLPDILRRACSLKVKQVEDGEPIERGTIYVSRPGFHMLVKPGKLRCIYGPRENGLRPAIDPLFRSAGKSYGACCVGVILTGMLDDGVAGLATIKQKGGTVLVQNPDEADFPSMPRTAVETVEVDEILSLDSIGPRLVSLSMESSPCGEHMSHEIEDPVEKSVEELRLLEQNMRPSTYTCPECHGTLFELNEGILHYRCRVGHSYNPEVLSSEQVRKIEAALWEALKSIEENLSLSKRLYEKTSKIGSGASSRRYLKKIEVCLERARLIQDVLNTGISFEEEGQESKV